MTYFNCVVCNAKLDEPADGIKTHPLCHEHEDLADYIDDCIGAHVAPLKEKFEQWTQLLNELDPLKRF